MWPVADSYKRQEKAFSICHFPFPFLIFNLSVVPQSIASGLSSSISFLSLVSTYANFHCLSHMPSAFCCGLPPYLAICFPLTVNLLLLNAMKNEKWKMLLLPPADFLPATAHSVACHFRLIRLATKPAPKPLSILTTVTFDEHELSIPSNAATPPNEAP